MLLSVFTKTTKDVESKRGAPPCLSYVIIIISLHLISCEFLFMRDFFLLFFFFCFLAFY